LASSELLPSVYAFTRGLMAGGNSPDCQFLMSVLRDRPGNIGPRAGRGRCRPWLFQDRFDRHLAVVLGGARAA
jgi:hypothetical protein